MTFPEMLKEIETFCRRGVHRMRRGRMSLEHLTEALVFHATRGTLAVVWDAPIQNSKFKIQNAEIVGVAVAWQTTRAHIEQAEREHQNVFDWQPSAPAGDCVYLALVLTSRHSALRPLAQYFIQRFPHWSTLPLLAHRRGKLKDETGLLNKLAGIPAHPQPH